MKETTRVLRETYMAPKLVQHIYNFKVFQNGDLHCSIGNYKQN